MHGFQVVMSRLRWAARAFMAEAGDFSGSLPPGGPAPPDGGGGMIDGALSSVLEAAGMLHARLVGMAERDGGDLEADYREYRNAEDAITHAVTVVVDPHGAGRDVIGPDGVVPDGVGPDKAR